MTRPDTTTPPPDDAECWHEGIECEHNTGEDACHCPCPDCAEWEDDDE